MIYNWALVYRKCSLMVFKLLPCYGALHTAFELLCKQSRACNLAGSDKSTVILPSFQTFHEMGKSHHSIHQVLNDPVSLQMHIKS
jgi:hypothetical protein